MWDDAFAYDVATGWYDDDLHYWKTLLETWRPRRVLEIASGTGRLTLPLAEAGLAYDPAFRIVGLDLSASFLNRTREKLRTASPGVAAAVSLVESDMRSFDLGEEFDLILLPYNSMAFLFDDGERLECLTAIRRHLARGGRFAIDMATPDLELLSEARHYFPRVRQELSRSNPVDGISFFAATYVSNYDPATQTESTTHYWQFFRENGAVETHVKHLTWHIYFPAELDLLMRMSGLRVETKYGDYQQTPFSSSSTQYLWVMSVA